MTNRDDMDDARMLRDGLRANPLSDEAMKRIRAATEAEWRATVATRSRRWRPMAIAASLLGVAVIAGLTVFAARKGDLEGEVLANLVRSEAPGVVEMRTFSDFPVTPGDALRSGRTYLSRGQALLMLEGGGNLRAAADARFEILGRDAVSLESGELYVDIPTGAHTAAAFVARTPAGEFRHRGTQFSLAVSDGETRLRVREGVVHWVAASGESEVEAGREVLISRDGKASQRSLSASDESWNWTSTTTPDFDVENRALLDFLAWVARESGRELVFVDDATRKQVSTILMHGNVKGLPPMQALSAVMAATPLRYDLPEGRIRVSSAGDSPTRR